jgi:hypothetical protein
MTKEIAAIFAVGPNDVIGIKDKMPWHSKQDFYHFKKVTKEILKNVAKVANINRKAQFVNAVWLLYVVGKR